MLLARATMNALAMGLSVGLLLVVSCGGDSDNTTTGGGGSDTGSGGSGASGSGGSSSGPATGSGAGSSGSATGAGGAVACPPGEVHVFPCCGGPAPFCEPLPDGGTCPPGTHPENCPDGPGCQMDPCVPPPSYCVDEDELNCSGSSCSTPSGDCSGYLEAAELSCQCA